MKTDSSITYNHLEEEEQQVQGKTKDETNKQVHLTHIILYACEVLVILTFILLAVHKYMN